jgi:hypothetical protein
MVDDWSPWPTMPMAGRVTVTMEVYTDGQRGWISAIGPKPSCGVSM